MSKIECGQTCVQSTCTSLTHKNGECIRYLMENYNGIVNASDKYRETMFDQSCSDIFYKNWCSYLYVVIQTVVTVWWGL